MADFSLSGGEGYQGNYKRQIVPRIPDFRIFPWQLKLHKDLIAENGKKAGYYKIFINERTGDFGNELHLIGTVKILLGWEEKFIYKDKELYFNYIAYQQDEKWVKLRVESFIPVKTVIMKAPRPMVCLNFMSYLGKSTKISFPLFI